VASGAALDCVALSRQGTGAATSISIGASIRSTPLMAPTARRSLGPAGWTWACYAALPLAAWSVYWLAFFPGVIAHDSLVQWKEILDGRYDDWHPAFHTWTLWLLTRPWRSLGAVSLSQVLITGLLVGDFLATARRLGVPAWAPWSVAAWLALSPVFGMNVIAVSKDTAFGLALLWTTGLLLRSRARGVLTAGDGAWLGVALALMWLFRHNGPATALPTLGAVAWCHWRAARRAILVAALVCATFVAVVKGPLYRFAHVEPATPKLEQQFVIHHVAGLLSAHTPLTSRERKTLGKILPIPTWRAAFVCHSGARLRKSGLRTGLLRRHPLALVAIWARLAARNPRGLLRHWTCVTRFIWSPRSKLSIVPLSPDGGAVEPNVLGVRADSWLPSAQRALARLVTVTFAHESVWRVLVWQPALSLYLLLGSLLVALWRARSSAPLLVWVPALCNTLVWLVLAESPGLRFQWPVVLLAPLLACFATADWQRGRACLPTRDGAA